MCATRAQEAPWSEGLTALAFDPQDPRRLYAGTARGFWTSEDGGATWQPRLHGLVGSTILALVDEPSSRGRLIASTPTGLYRTENGGETWVPIPAEGDGPIVFLAAAPCPQGIWGATQGGMVFRLQGGALRRFSAIPLPEGASLKHFLSAPEGDCKALTLFAGDSEGNLWYSPDGGASWQMISPHLPGASLATLACLEGRAPGLCVAGGAFLYRLVLTEEGRFSWQRLAQAPLDSTVTHVAMSEAHPRHLYVITETGTLYRFVEEGNGWRLQGQEAIPRGVEVRVLLSLVERGREVLLVITPEGAFIS
ncbi:MAG: hypothetical protein H5T70_07840, partial [Chloroflexi bacterium]|nr:hypothetical protein [Chloroflexota bacterium]